MYYGLDERGVVLPALPVVAGSPRLTSKKNSPLLPIVTGFTPDSIVPGEKLAEPQCDAVIELLNLIQKDHPLLLHVLFEINVEDPDNMIGYPSARFKIVRFGCENLPQRVARLEEAWRHFERMNLAGEYLDLRFDEQGVVFSMENQSVAGRVEARLTRSRFDPTEGVDG